MPATPVAIPRGIEVLVKKASVDPAFREVLLARRAEVAKEIGLTLEPPEAMLLAAVPAEQLKAIIASTTVSPMSRAAFLGKAAAAMLAVLGSTLKAPGVQGGTSFGVQPGIPPVTDGIRPDYPPQRERLVLYSEADFRGETKFAVVEEDAYAERAGELAAMNRVLRRAFIAARDAWGKDDAHKGTSFPLRTPRTLQCNRVATYSTRDKAEAALAKRQEELDKKAEAARKANERRLAAMSEKARANEERKARDLKAAEALFESELQRFTAASRIPKPRKAELNSPASEGIRPDRP